jgi:hypothetical protein
MYMVANVIDIQDSITLSWQKLINTAQELAQAENMIKWGLADLFLQVKLNSAYGSNRLENFAKAIDRGKTTAYNYVNVATFYDDNAIRHEIDGMMFVTFYKAELVMRYVGNAYDAMAILRECNGDDKGGGWTIDELRLELESRFNGKIKPPAPLYDGLYTRSQIRDVVNALPPGEYRVIIKKA